MTESWRAVDEFFEALLVEPDPALAAALDAAAAAGLPPHDVTPMQGKLLNLLARVMNARAILEVGTLAGYSTIWLGRALPPGGRLVTLERDPRAAAVARANLALAGLAHVEVREGDARDLLDDVDGPFDMIFIDADKRSNPIYLEHALRLSRPGTLIVADNVVRAGTVAEPDTVDEQALGIREFAQRLADEPRVSATALQTVGTKGHDGFVVALVTA